MIKRRLSRIIEYTLPGVLAAALFGIVLFVNGLWPFGRDTIDYYDMAQWAMPFYYHNYDELHGLKSFLFDWYTNLGRVIPGLNEPSLTDLILCLLPRNMLLEYMSVMMAFRIGIAAAFMGIFIRYVNKDMPYMFRLIISAGYGLCGFVLINYTVPQWLDMMAVVPLILMFSQIALREGRILGLSLSIFMIMILDYYFTIQTLMFVFLAGGAFLLIIGKKQKGELYVVRFALGVLGGLGLSAFSWIPDILSNMTSARFGNGVDDGGLAKTYLEILRSVQPAYMSRWFTLLGLAFPTALVLVGMGKRFARKEYRSLAFGIVCIFMTTAQLFVESIHLILHFGSYVDYPMRNGFLIYCVISGLAVGYYEADKDRTAGAIGIATDVITSFVIVVLFVRWYENSGEISDHTVLMFTMGFMAVCAVADVVLIALRRGRGCICIWIAEMLIFGIIMIGKPAYISAYGNDPEQEGEYIRITDQLTEQFGTKLATGYDAATRRIKNPDTSLNANYGVVMRRETLSGWTNLATSDQIGGAVSMGYSSQFTRILDSGGNIFFDTMLHITEAISCMNLDDRLYEKTASADVVIDHITGEKDSYGLYRNRFSLPFAMPVRDSMRLFDNTSDVVDLVNAYSSALGCPDKIAEKVDEKPDILSSNGHEISTYHIRVAGNKTLYFTGSCVDTDYYNTIISVNGSVVPVPGIKETDNYLFPAHFNNNTVELGSFTDEDIVVSIDMDITDPGQKYDNFFYEIDTDALGRLCDDPDIHEEVIQGPRSLDITVDYEGDYDGILIPVSYNKGWSADADGREADIENANGLFMFIKAPDTETIHMSYFPPYMRTGVFIAVLSAVCLAGTVIHGMRGRIYPAAADRILSYTYICAYAVAFMIIYAIPIIYAIKSVMFST